MKKILILLLVGGFLLTGTLAYGFSLGGYMGPLEFKFSDFTDGLLYGANSPLWPAYGNQNGTSDSYSIFKVSNIKDPAANDIWQNGDAGEQLVGIFYGIDDDRWTVSGGGTRLDIESVGGKILIYLQNDGVFNPTAGPNPLGHTGVYPTVGDHVSSILFLSGDLVPVIAASNGNQADDHITFINTLTSTTSPFTGDGAFYISLTGGAYYDLFNSNGFGGGLNDSGNLTPIADLWAQFDSTARGPFGWLASSEDPVRGSAVPEPATMLLLGFGLIGLAGYGRRRFSKK